MQQTVIPQLRMTDATRSLPFYIDGLGFKVDWEHRFEPGFPLFAQLTRRGQTIFLTEHTGDCAVGGAVYFIVPDTDELVRDVRQRGVLAIGDPEDMPWGTREVLITDPDGNRLRFASDKADEDETGAPGA
ncbi:bleomycin resistance protein [Tahibacter amnicola]|uniref:Bleomycin resistance protein n=1 Tax=Tahibacter amnicola TaxID=2976241 RepID=A0ABY6B927_9GAMM|nr:VOC family protein [Tahibacter amnicola]UXI66374.1 VOC family protein [Tahibacter amnicola]